MSRPHTNSAQFVPVGACAASHSRGGELGFPFPYCLMGKDEAPLQEHFWQIFLRLPKAFPGAHYPAARGRRRIDLPFFSSTDNL